MARNYSSFSLFHLIGMSILSLLLISGCGGGQYDNTEQAQSPDSGNQPPPNNTPPPAPAPAPTGTLAILGTPKTTAIENRNYSYIPTVTDPGNGALRFSISNKPAWAAFNTTTGQLSGTPSSGNVGSYPNIRITVSNNDSSFSTSAFTLNVVSIVVNGGPTLLYSDLVAGPAGSFVTVWGQNIPTNATFNCGNQPCRVISFDYDLNHPAHGNQPSRQKIVVQFDSGSGITLVGGNTIPFTLTNGRIHEFTTNNFSLNNVNSGDVVYLHGGFYNNNGTFIEGKNGVAVVGYPGENAVVDCSNGAVFDADVIDLVDFTLANLEMDCGGTGRAIRANRQGSRTNLRIVGNHLHDAASSNSGAFGEFSTTVDLYILGNLVERTGVAGENNAHAIYHGGRGYNDNVHISYNRIDNHLGGRAIQLFGHREGESLTNLFIRGNNITNAFGNAAILVSHSDAPAGVAPTDPSRGWIKDALIDYNTVSMSNGSGVNIKSPLVDAIINNNVLIDGTSISIDYARSVEANNNCLDSAIRSDMAYTGSNNNTNYPSCL